MTVPLAFRDRVSPRQAIVVVYEDASVHTPVQAAKEPLLLDLLGTLVGVNGVSLAVVATNRTMGRRIAKSLPAGVELLVPPAGEPAIGWTTSKLVAKGFERVLVVASDVIGLPVRVISTALSAIASESVIRADTPLGNPYLVGISTTQLPNATDFLQLKTLDQHEALERIAPTRGMERFSRLSEIEDRGELRELVVANSRLLPRLFRQLDQNSIQATPEPEAYEGQHL